MIIDRGLFMFYIFCVLGATFFLAGCNNTDKDSKTEGATLSRSSNYLPILLNKKRDALIVTPVTPYDGIIHCVPSNTCTRERCRICETKMFCHECEVCHYCGNKRSGVLTKQELGEWRRENDEMEEDKDKSI